MNTALRRATSLMLGLLLAAGVLATTALQPAQAYPDQTCNIQVATDAVRAGGTLTVTGELVPMPDPVTAAGFSWTVTFAGQVAHGDGGTFAHTFAVPDVDEDTTLPLKAVAESGDVVCNRTVNVAIDVQGGVSPPGGLPNTGGPHLWILALGVALLLGGLGALRVGRTRA